MYTESIRGYLNSNIYKPYFLFTNNEQYINTLNELKLLGLRVVSISEYCNNNDDKVPNTDDFSDYIKAISNEKIVVIGLGEYLAVRGVSEAKKMLQSIKDYDIFASKVVLLLRGLNASIESLHTDLRFDVRRYDYINSDFNNLTVTVTNIEIDKHTIKGFKNFLVELENGKNEDLIVKTEINFEDSLFNVNYIKSAYEAIKLLIHDFNLSDSCGSNENWNKLLSDINKNNNISNVFKIKKFDFNTDNLYKQIIGNDYVNWLYFIFLKLNSDKLKNTYLQHILNITNDYNLLIYNIINNIIDISHKDNNFLNYYNERKQLIKGYPESDIADFVVNNRIDLLESIHKLTDTTRVEREEIIAWISNNGYIPEINDIYPDLYNYTQKYIFKNIKIADTLTDYFEAYKKQKLLNKIEPEFLKKVDELAINRIYNQLSSRNEIVNETYTNDTYLYWIDALGVEYLSLIESMVIKRGLSIRINITRAELPTITSCNKDFYDLWQGEKEKNNELDEIKHKDNGGYNFNNNELPIHIVREIEVITEIIDKAATKLALRQCKRFVIASDHGASRLAILRRKEEKYETDTKGEHSGRCCNTFNSYDLPFATEENGYIVLADYGRFKGSRAANVEVHGGASLEEVTVPVIELTLRDDSITVKIVDEIVTIDFRNEAKITLFFNSKVQNVSVIINKKHYSSTQTDDNHFNVILDDIKRAGVYYADVYVNDDLIKNIKFEVKTKSAKLNTDFDDLF